MPYGPFDDAKQKLRALGLALIIAPGEYIVNFTKDTSATEYRTDDLADALAHGLAMGPPPVTLPPLGPMGTGGAKRRGKMYAHNRKLAARRRKQESKV